MSSKCNPLSSSHVLPFHKSSKLLFGSCPFSVRVSRALHYVAVKILVARFWSCSPVGSNSSGSSWPLPCPTPVPHAVPLSTGWRGAGRRATMPRRQHALDAESDAAAAAEQDATDDDDERSAPHKGRRETGRVREKKRRGGTRGEAWAVVLCLRVVKRLTLLCCS